MPFMEKDIWSDPTCESALQHIENPEIDLDDWNLDDGTAVIFLNSKSLVQLGKSKLSSIDLNKYFHTQTEFIAQAETLLKKKISRKTLSEWEGFGLFEKGIKINGFKYYSQDALHELYASWLLTRNEPGWKKCSLREAGRIRSIYITARNEGTLEDDILRFIEPGEIVSTLNPRWMPNNIDYESVMTDLRVKEWLRYMVLSQHSKDPLDHSYIIHYKKITDLTTGIIQYGTSVTTNN